MSLAKIRDELTLEEDRYQVASLLRKGYRSAKQIADIVNKDKTNSDVYMSPSMVSSDIKAIKQNYKEQQLEDYNAYRNELIDNLLALKATLWEKYELSCQPRVASIEWEEIVLDEDTEHDLKVGMVMVTNETQAFAKKAKIRQEHKPDGNSQLLQQVFMIEDKISKIYGVDAPSKVALTDPSGEKEAQSPLQDILLKLSEIGEKPKELVENNA